MDNIDPASFDALFAALDPARTGLVAISKSGGTAETMSQFAICIDWLRAKLDPDAVGRHTIAITEPRDNPLRFSQCVFLSAYAQFPFSDRLNDQLVSRLQARRRAAFRRDYDATLLIDPSPTLHDTSPDICHSKAYMAFRMPSDKRSADRC